MHSASFAEIEKVYSVLLVLVTDEEAEDIQHLSILLHRRRGMSFSTHSLLAWNTGERL